VFSLLGFSQNFAWWAAISIALLPAALNWWWTHALRASADSAALPERHLAIAQRVSAATFLCSVVIGVLLGWNGVWIVLLELLALGCTRYRTRRALLGETWPLHRYLAWRMRVTFGVSGFVWFLAFAPALVATSTDAHRWTMAGITLLIGLAWHHWYGRVIIAAIGASRLSRLDLEGPFEEVIRRSQVPPQPVWRAGEPGGVFANALALPSLNQTGVIFFDTLLERLTLREITAIFAHEIAHLEHFTRRRMIRAYAVTTALMTVLIVSAAAGGRFVRDFEVWMPAASFIIVFIGLWLRARRMQPKETEADLRAVELCGDAEALIGGLTRLYAINHIPRRWSATMEQQATHPSLARRINAIRRHASPSPPPVAIERVVVASPDPGRLAFIDRDRVGFLWYDGSAPQAADDLFDSARRAEMVAFSDLRELRLAAAGPATLTLNAVDRRGHRWSMSIHERDAAQIQTTLDRVDHLIVAPVATDHQVSRRVIMLVVVAFASAFNGLLAVLAPTLLALRRPSRPLILAISAALTTTALLKAEDASVEWTGMIVLALLAGIGLLGARQKAQETSEAGPRVWLERLALALPVAIGLVLIAGSTVDLFDLHTAVRERSWVAAAMAALSVFLVLSPDRLPRRVGAATGAVALLVMAIGSPWFLLGVVRDPLAAEMPTLSERRVPLVVSSIRSVEGEFTSVTVASDGHTFLLAAEEDEPEDDDAPPMPRRYLAGTFKDWTRTFEASEAVLVDAHRVLALDRERGTSRLRAADASTGQELWTLSLPDGEPSMLQADPEGRWRAIARRGSRFTGLAGRIGSPDVNTQTWTIDSTREAYVDTLRIDQRRSALATSTLWQRPPAPWLGSEWRETTTLMNADDSSSRVIATSRLSVDCAAPPIGITGYVCVSFDGRWSRFWRFDPAAGGLHPAGQTRHGLWRVQQQTHSQLIASLNGRPALVDLEAGRMQTLVPAWDGCWMTDFAVVDDVVVGVCAQGGMTRVTRYRVTSRTGGPSSTAHESARMSIGASTDPHATTSR
jgi:Zn-dependent protease with chaperone function